VKFGFAVALAAAAAAAFLFGALEPYDATEAAFAAALLGLAAAACAGPFLFSDGDSRGLRRIARAGLRALLLGAAVVLVAGVFSGRWGAALGCGLFCALFAYALAALADLMRGRVAAVLVGAAGLTLLFTLHLWDDLFLFGAADRAKSAHLAFSLNPAAAASRSLGFDWVHAKALYADNQTAESTFGVPLPGLVAYSAKLALVAAAATGLGLIGRRK